MAWDQSAKMLQMVAAALGIPAAIGGAYSAYHTYFSNEAVCQQLRSEILGTMERKIPADSKRVLLRKDVGDFNKRCGDGDPDARVIFQAALQAGEPETAKTAVATSSQATMSPAANHAPSIGVFGAAGNGEQRGWVALNRRDQPGASWTVNFSGYAISETSLPPSGTILTAQRMLPVWSEIQSTVNDQTKLRARLPVGACVRVVTTHGGTGRLWAEVLPARCS